MKQLPANFKLSHFEVIPAPYEETVSYGQGTGNGPAAILEAAKQVEQFDEEILIEASRLFDSTTGNPVHGKGQRFRDDLAAATARVLSEGKIPVILGGEHSLTPAAVKAVAKQFPRLSVLQIDAHADLRDSYQGNPWSHACAMRRVLELVPGVQVGIRNIAKDEYDYAVQSGQLNKIHFAGNCADRSGLKEIRSAKDREKAIKKIIDQLSDDVYVSIDVDGLDPSIMPSTGTPEPGGLHWNDLIDLLKICAKTKKIRGFDVVELAPIKGMHAPDFLCAKLVFKLTNLISLGKR